MEHSGAGLLTWRDIPGHFDFEDLYTEAVARASNDAHFVEIGTLFGRSACFMAEAIRVSGKCIRFDTIDLFKRAIGPRNGETRVLDPVHNPGTSPSLWSAIVATGSIGAAARYCIARAGCVDLINLVHASGQENVVQYADESLDFVFVDAAHTYIDTVELLRLYLPKVKPGGVLAGHDYNSSFPGVVRAVADVLGSVEVRGQSFVYRKV